VLARNPVCALLGPRQCGKTTLARELVRGRKDAHFFDLETAAGRRRLAEPELALAPLRGLVVIDEIQREPGLFAALRPLAGPYAAGLFALGLLNAGLFSVAIIPLSTAYAVCEAFGWEAGLDRSPREAPIFVGLFTAMIVASALVILLPGIPLIPVMLFSQVLNGVLLPFVLVFLILLTGDREIMGPHRNSSLFSTLAWVLVAALAALSVLLAVATLVR